jgi:hypothetical protein
MHFSPGTAQDGCRLTERQRARGRPERSPGISHDVAERTGGKLVHYPAAEFTRLGDITEADEENRATL